MSTTKKKSLKKLGKNYTLQDDVLILNEEEEMVTIEEVVMTKKDFIQLKDPRRLLL